MSNFLHMFAINHKLTIKKREDSNTRKRYNVVIFFFKEEKHQSTKELCNKKPLPAELMGFKSFLSKFSHCDGVNLILHFTTKILGDENKVHTSGCNSIREPTEAGMSDICTSVDIGI